LHEQYILLELVRTPDADNADTNIDAVSVNAHNCTGDRGSKGCRSQNSQRDYSCVSTCFECVNGLEIACARLQRPAAYTTGYEQDDGPVRYLRIKQHSTKPGRPVWRRIVLSARPQFAPPVASGASYPKAVLPFIALKDRVSELRAACFAPDDARKLASGEKPMVERINSCAPMLLGAVLASLATVTVTFDSPVWADEVCIEQPPHPVAEDGLESAPYEHAACHSCHVTATTEVLQWNVRYDRAKGRKCWFLLDAHGRDVTKSHVRSSPAPTLTSTETAPTSYVPPATFSSKIASLFGDFNFMGRPANAPPISPPQVGPPASPRKHEGNSANAKKTDSVVHAVQTSIGNRHEAKRVSQVIVLRERRALFEEFLRWREYEEIFKTSDAPALKRQ
jgi:hypothetical protein